MTTPGTPPVPSYAPPKKPQWPVHNAPRVWFLTDGLAPIAIALSRHLLEHGDYIVAGIVPEEFDSPRGDELKALMADVARESNEGEEMLDVDTDEEDDEEEEDEEQGQEDTAKAKGKAKSGVNNSGARRKRWREHFKLVGFDGRYGAPS